MMQSSAGHERGFGNEVKPGSGVTDVLLIVAAVLFVVVMVYVIRDWIKEFREWWKNRPKLIWPPDDGGESYTDEEWDYIERWQNGEFDEPGEYDDGWDKEDEDEGESDGNDDEWWTPK